MRPSILRHRLAAGLVALAVAIGFAPAAWAADSADVLAVSASSTEGMLMDAVDGDPSTFWQNKAAGERDAWLAIRFEAPVTLRAVRLTLGALPPGATYDLETSLDGVTYTPQHRGLTAVSERPVELALKKVSALYVRVRFRYSGAGTPPRYRVLELEALRG